MSFIGYGIYLSQSGVSYVCSVACSCGCPDVHSEQQASHFFTWSLQGICHFSPQVYKHIHTTPDLSIHMGWWAGRVCIEGEIVSHFTVSASTCKTLQIPHLFVASHLCLRVKASPCIQNIPGSQGLRKTQHVLYSISCPNSTIQRFWKEKLEF